MTNNYKFITGIPAVKKKDFRGNNKGDYYYNHPASFDIETTSFYSHDDKHEKTAIMYIWQFCIKYNDKYMCVTGRTWQEFFALLIRLKFMLGLDDHHKMIIYVHNLSYEFQFIRKLFTWDKVFALDNRKVCYAVNDVFEFRCSYLLSGYSLDNLAKAYNLKTQKSTMDYDTIRTPNTILTPDEIEYCLNDVKVVCDYIEIKIKQYGNVATIPLTQTGEVRKECRKKVLHPNQHNKLSKSGYLIQGQLTMDVKEFQTCRQAFQGGFTHANAFRVGAVHEHVSSYDFTSSYPYVMLSEMYPMSKGVYIDRLTNDDYEKLNKKFLTIAVIEFTNIKPTDVTDNPISLSRIIKPKGAITNNGRIVYLKHGYMAITNIDFEVYRKFYNFGYRVLYLYAYRKQYLPKEYIQLIFEYYNKKTTLKGVEGKEIEYMHAKQKLNSLYGMMVTNPLRPEIRLLNDVWTVCDLDINEALDKYNNSKTRFTFYPWGVFVTAYARRNLFTGIKEFGRDYIYSDTDSIKVLNKDHHQQYIEEYNQETQRKINIMARVQGITYDVPKTIKGVPKPIGVWDYEGTYDHFKTLGAKRYLCDNNGDLHITVSGIRKKEGQKYLSKFDDPYKKFSDGLTIPKDETGKKLLTYIDSDRKGTIIDYQGHEYEYHEKSCIHMENTTCSIGLASEFIRYLENIIDSSELGV